MFTLWICSPFIFTYCFSALTQVKLDPFLLTFPTHLYVSTCKFYLLAFSMQQSFFYTCNTLAMRKWRNSVKLKRTSSTSVLVVGVELQVSGHFASGAMESSIYYYFLNTAGFLEEKNPKPHKYQSSLRLERTEFLWERGNMQRGRVVTGSESQVCLCIDVNWMDEGHPPGSLIFQLFLTHVNTVIKITEWQKSGFPGISSLISISSSSFLPGKALTEYPSHGSGKSVMLQILPQSTCLFPQLLVSLPNFPNLRRIKLPLQSFLLCQVELKTAHKLKNYCG